MGAVAIGLLVFFSATSILAYSYLSKNSSEISELFVEALDDEPETYQTDLQRLNELESKIATLEAQLELAKSASESKAETFISVTTDTKPATAPTPKPPEPKEVCYEYNIREGDFKSHKCYSKEDYDDLVYFLSRYNQAVFSYNSAISGMKITCDSGSDFFKDACKEDKDQKEEAEDDIDEYKDKVNNLISKGKSV